MRNSGVSPFLLLAATALFTNPAWAQSLASWVPVNSYDGRFQVLSPGLMPEKTDSIKTPLGTLAYRVHFYQPEDKTADNLLYMISWCDYPEGSFHPDSIDLLDEFFHATMESAAFSVKGTVVYSDAWEMDGHRGRIWRIDYLDGNAIIKTRAFVAGDRYYALQTVSRKERHLNPSGEKFFDSFRLIEHRKSKSASKTKKKE
ncbi:MAG: hypothetical protein HUU01_16500 [Saprospiraceae bacterium]|nr:hypothetical protein [Saprospiraceae bacterium]